ncbi:MAG: hypothetical protein A3J24_07520 [Deltaproteobacteria bacterium RIFCSPLOWO2_02_FULL_53_8]|nr:MAG: hypothetical protein A3J24_07520 [Deltaproteobacteria bacterium RIFCSPLOWO2_02_FULL_53_8]
MNSIIAVFLLVAAAVILNLPFGYFRAPTKKFSFKWFLYIHLPIPFIYLLRTLAQMSYRVIPLLVLGAIIGQVIGARLNSKGKAQDAG